jgi:hypothetical protein
METGPLLGIRLIVKFPKYVSQEDMLLMLREWQLIGGALSAFRVPPGGGPDGTEYLWEAKALYFHEDGETELCYGREDDGWVRKSGFMSRNPQKEFFLDEVP